MEKLKPLISKALLISSKALESVTQFKATSRRRPQDRCSAECLGGFVVLYGDVSSIL